MKIFRHLPAHSDLPTAVAVGNFDGLHRGHKAVVEAMRQLAAAHGAVPSVLTFEPHPRRLFAPQGEAFRLEPLALKLRRLKAAGVERVYMPRFTRAFADLTADEFLNTVLKQSLGARAVVTGENFSFGRGREGNVARLAAWGKSEAIEVLQVKPVLAEGEVCSSSAIRRVVDAGDMAGAARLLGHPYRVEGRVRPGDGRGAGMGFATANLALPPGIKWPRHGVYAVRVTLPVGVFDGVANLGVRPTVAAGLMPNLEVHLFGSHPVLYGQKMAVDFYGFVRAEKKFDSLAALTAQIAEDCTAAKNILSQLP